MAIKQTGWCYGSEQGLRGCESIRNSGVFFTLSIPSTTRDRLKPVTWPIQFCPRAGITARQQTARLPFCFCDAGASQVCTALCICDLSPDLPNESLHVFDFHNIDLVFLLYVPLGFKPVCDKACNSRESLYILDNFLWLK